MSDASRDQAIRDIEVVFGQWGVEYEGGFSLVHLIGLKLCGEIYFPSELDSALDDSVIVEFTTTILSATLVHVRDGDDEGYELSIAISPLSVGLLSYDRYHAISELSYNCRPFAASGEFDDFSDDTPSEWRSLPAIWTFGHTDESDDGDYAEFILPVRLTRIIF